MVFGYWDVFISFAVRSSAFGDIVTVTLYPRLGYTWDPEIVTQITGALAFYPFCTLFTDFWTQREIYLRILAAAITFLTAMSVLPVLLFQRKFGDVAFRLLAWASMASSALAFFFMAGIASVAKRRFEQQGYTANYGNLV